MLNVNAKCNTASRLSERSYDYVNLRNSCQNPAKPKLMVKHEHAPESSYSNLPVSANHSIINRGTSHIKPPLPLLRTDIVTASVHSEKRSDNDYDYAETRMTDSYVEVNEYEDTSLLNGVKCYYECIASTKITGLFFNLRVLQELKLT